MDRSMSLRFEITRQITAALASTALLAITPPAVQDLRYPGHFFTILLESDKRTYRAGEPINIRISVTNVTDQSYILALWQPRASLPLSVQTDQGAQVAPTVPGHIERIDFLSGFTPTHRLSPRATMTVGWLDIAEFGYTLKPGTYTIMTSLRGAAYRSAPHREDSFGMNGEDKSNAIIIKILPARS
jgi:hypothetical protein